MTPKHAHKNTDANTPISETEDNPSQSSSTGQPENIAGLLCYLPAWIGGLVFYLIEKDMELWACGKPGVCRPGGQIPRPGKDAGGVTGKPAAGAPHAVGGIVLP